MCLKFSAVTELKTISAIQLSQPLQAEVIMEVGLGPREQCFKKIFDSLVNKCQP